MIYHQKLFTLLPIDYTDTKAYVIRHISSQHYK